jgi:hypothetical protein
MPSVCPIAIRPSSCGRWTGRRRCARRSGISDLLRGPPASPKGVVVSVACSI